MGISENIEVGALTTIMYILNIKVKIQVAYPT